MSRRIAILFGSQTGTAESYAKMLCTYAMSHGLAPELCSMNDGVALFSGGGSPPEAVVFICSTYGTGEFPSNATKFWKALSEGQLPRLGQVPHAIFGLGNSHNEHYNAAAKNLGKQLLLLGSRSLMQLQLSCELQANGHDGTFRSWKRSLFKALGANAEQGRPTVGTLYTVKPASGAAEPHVVRPGFVQASVVTNVLRTPPRYTPRARLIQLSLTEDLQRQSMGRLATNTDHVQVFPTNNESLVNRMLRRMGLNADDAVEIVPRRGAASSPFDNKRLSVRTLLTEVVDLSGIPSRSLLETMSMVAAAPTEVERLEAIADDLSVGSAYEKLSAGIFTVVDALEMFPSVKLSLEQLLTIVPHIAARTYSIAQLTADADDASPTFMSCCSTVKTARTSHIDILYKVPTCRTDDGRSFQGLCSSMMDGLTLGDHVTIRFEPSNIALPRDDAPCLLIALGTGVGSVYSILQRRFAMCRKGEKIGPARLYYGMHDSKESFFKAELDEMAKQPGFLSVVYAATNEGPRAMDRLDASLVEFVGRDGHITYCGAGGSAPLTLENNLRRCGFDLAQLRREGRLHEEFFTADRDAENLFRNATTEDAAPTLAGRMGKCEMFCFQCEQTFKGRGCHKIGVCGKTPRVAALQDLTVEGCKVLGFYAHELRQMGVVDDATNWLTLFALFATLTNVNFDETRFVKIIADLKFVTQKAKTQYHLMCKTKGVAAKRPLRAKELPAAGYTEVAELEDLGREVSVLNRFTDPATQSAAGVTEMLVYGIKGIAAYADHSLMNGKENPEIYAFMHKALAFMTTPDQYDLGKGLELLLEAGRVNVATMGLLYESNSTLGVPTPTAASLKPTRGKAILVSGHDLIILKGLLEVTEPLGINVYTHGEMLPGHSYPKLKQHKNLVGHFGGAWMRQAVEFPHFPGPILMTTNCITEPHETYAARIFTAGAVGWKGVPHIGNNMADIKFTELIRAAQAAPGFVNEQEFSYADGLGVRRPPALTVGFGHETILSVAPTIVEEIQKGNITRFFLVGGCDGYEGERSYFTDLVARLPKTAVVLTVGCGKFRFNYMDLGTIGETGIPRILDMGQCNDSFSAVQVALALAKVLNCKVSDLPLSIVLSWFEQKAIAVLLSCLALELKPIHVGPALPAFITPDVLGVLVANFGIRALGNVDDDLREMLAAPGAS